MWQSPSTSPLSIPLSNYLLPPLFSLTAPFIFCLLFCVQDVSQRSDRDTELKKTLLALNQEG